MKKRRHFENIRFDSKTFFEAEKGFRFLASSKISYGTLSVALGNDEEWFYDSFEEFLAAANQGLAEIGLSADKHLYLHVISRAASTTVTVAGPTREQIEQIFSIFEKDAERCRLPEPEEPEDLEEPEEPEEQTELKVFIGHGADPQWKDLKDHLHEKHGYAVTAYEIGARAGHVIRDILEDMLDESYFAFLVMTGEEKTEDSKLLPRQNVVHEAGLFQGRLGFSRAIVLLEDGPEQFSNIAGLQQIRFPKGKIRETFGDVLAVLYRELDAETQS